MNKRAPSLLAMLAVSGCAGAPHPVPVAAHVTAPGTWRSGQAASRPVHAGWWQDFGDPVLDRLISRTLENNEDLRIAALRITEARARLRLADSERLPDLSIGASAASSRSLNAFGVAVDQQQGHVSASSGYEVDLFGRLRRSSEAARADLLATKEARDVLRMSMIATVVDGYIGLRGLDSRLAILNETSAERSRERDVLRRRYRAGYASRLDEQRAQAAYDATLRLIPATQRAIRARENALSVLTGQVPAGIERGQAGGLAGEPAVPASLPSQVLRQRPDIAEAEARLAAADARLGVARAAFMPGIQLSASGGAGVSTLLGSPVTLFDLGGGLLAPIFARARLGAQRDIARARRDEAAFAYRATVIGAFREVEDAMAAVASATAQARAAKREVEADRQVYHTAKRRYEAGYSSYLDQLDGERALLAARLDADGLRFERLSALVSLYRALGGGWRPEPSGP